MAPAVTRACEIPGQRQAGHDLCQHLQHLADGGGGHVLMTLAVAAVSAGQADQQHGRSEHEDALGRLYVVERVGQLVRDQRHDQRAGDAQHKERPPRDREYAPHLIVAAHRVRLAYHARERHGQTRGGQREEHAVYVVGDQEVRVALIAEDVAQRYLVDSTEYLHYNDAGGQYCRAVEIVLLFGFCQNPFLLSSPGGTVCLLYTKIMKKSSNYAVCLRPDS